MWSACYSGSVLTKIGAFQHIVAKRSTINLQGDLFSGF
jgi:hypothetical protein